MANPSSSRERIARPLLPDESDPAYRDRIADECRRLAVLTPDEDAMASAFGDNARLTPGWKA